MKIINQTRNATLAVNAIVADNPLTRVRGLLGRKHFEEGSALIIKPSNSIHTFFMRFPIDLLFVDRDSRIIKAISSMKPFRLSAVYLKSAFVVELPAGVITATSTQAGDIIQVS